MPSNADLAAMLSKLTTDLADVKREVSSDIAGVRREIASDLADVKREIATLSKAFPTNDIGDPDFDGHRKAHVGMIAAAKAMDGYKVEVTKKLVTYLVAFVVGVMATGVLQTAREWFAPSQKVSDATKSPLHPS